MEPSNFQRVNDTLYRTLQKDNKELFVNFKGTFSKDSFETAKKISEQLPNFTFDKNTRVLFKDHGITYAVELQKPEKQSWIAWFFSSFFTSYQNPNKVTYQVTELASNKPARAIELHCKPTNTLRVDIPKNDPKSKAFSDGYTQLATQAFQKFEPLFKAHDIKGQPPTADLSKYVIVQIGDKLELVEKGSVSDGGNACKQYLKFINKEYGEEKVSYVAHQFGISFEGPLTPEMVYRINIGMGNIEIQDLKALQGKIKKGTALTTHEERVLKRAPKNFSPDNLSKLASLFSLKTEEQDAQYTGRKIAYPIDGSYAIAHTEKFKPWVDQQELSQVFTELKNAKNPDRFHELISFVVCKKHFARRHPTEDYRVGAIIPAPTLKENGKPDIERFYVVTSLVTNSQGILSYTLEPLDPKDKTLHAIKSFLNTSPSRYALSGFGTIRNDFNFINSPGNEGKDLCKKYEEDFDKKYTIPNWVGYTLQAKNAKNPAKQKEALINAVKSFEEYKTLPTLPKPLGKIVRTHDAALIQLAQNVFRQGIFNIFNLIKLVYILLKYKDTTAKDSLDASDARFILKLIDRNDPLQATLTKDLLDTIHVSDEKAQEIQKIHKQMNVFAALMNDKDYSGAITALESIAMKEKEYPFDVVDPKTKVKIYETNKVQQSLLFVGHSLGAAASEKAYADICISGRMPLPDCEIGVRGFDPPGINAVDNKNYKSLSKHIELFKGLRVQHSLVYRIATGDVVSQGGEEQLGVAYTPEERDELLSWTRFDASVSSRTEKTTVPEIREAVNVHAIHFEAGVRSPTPFKAELLSKVKKVSKDHFDRDYERTWVDPIVLKRFAHGEKHVWKDLQKLWKVVGIRSNVVEKLRTLFSIALRIILVTLEINRPDHEQEDVGHGDWWRYKDNLGVFAVDLNGVASQRA